MPINASPPFTDLTGMQLDSTLGQQLIPVVDGLRDLLTSFGIRPYVLRVVRVQWSGARRGYGQPYVKATRDILPTPKITDLSGLTEVANPVGLDEIGNVLVTQISGSFTDEFFRFVTPDNTELNPNEEVFYEIEFPQPSGKPGEKRRFALRGAPMYFASKFYWQLRLERTRSDRPNNGDPNE